MNYLINAILVKIYLKNANKSNLIFSLLSIKYYFCKNSHKLNTVYILLGGNVGNSTSYFMRAKEMIENHLGCIKNQSMIYETEPWGFQAQQHFLNQVIEINTDKNAEHTLLKLIEFENILGREKTSIGYESRTIDLDILFFNSEIIDKKDLQIPHPRMHQRKFTLIPLNEIATNKIHPILQTPIWSILKDCKDSSKVKICKNAE
jgi:2-amino-4-hydroxy-6-hydroxymethyldihydropteridine diphosphokinase